MENPYILTYDEIKRDYVEVDKDRFYEIIGPHNVQLSVHFCKTDEVYCYTTFSLKFPYNTIGVEVTLQKIMRGDYKRKKEYYIKKNIYEKD